MSSGRSTSEVGAGAVVHLLEAVVFGILDPADKLCVGRLNGKVDLVARFLLYFPAVENGELAPEIEENGYFDFLVPAESLFRQT